MNGVETREKKLGGGTIWTKLKLKMYFNPSKKLEGLKYVKMSNRTTEPGAWWLEKETNDVIRIISRDSVRDDVKGGPIYEASIFYQYYTDDKNRNLMSTQWVSTVEDLCEKFKFKMG